MKKIIFCTYFDKNYLPKGLALHASLLRDYKDAKLWILCMDNYTYDILNGLSLEGVKLIKLRELENRNRELLSIKKTRTLVEYYWTCTPYLPLYILDNLKNCEMVVYLDADIYFYSSINKIIEEFGDKSIYLVEHRYPKNQIERCETSGRFNVGLLIWRNDKEGKDCLLRWKKQCFDWCYFREENSKMGDQMYLNQWPGIYKKTVISKNLGVNAAPWNINQYKITVKKEGIFLNEDCLICYHFHQFDFLKTDKYYFPYGYRISGIIKRYI